MKILFLDQFSEPGGAQRCLLDLLPAIASRGWSQAVAMPGAGSMFARVRALGCEAVAVEFGPYGIGRKSALDVARFGFETPRLAGWITRHPADLIYVNGPRLLPAAALGARGRPLVFHAHSYLAEGYAAWLSRWAIRRARATVIASCRFVAEPVHAGRPRIVHNGVADTGFRARHGPPQRIGVIGRIAAEKGQADFLRAARLLGAQFRYVICGAPLFSASAYETEVRKLADGLPVDFLGWREDVGDVLSDLDLLVVPSIGPEATPRVILEAYAAGVPVVAFRAGGISELIEDGVTGFLVSPSRPEALAAGIQQAARADLSAMAVAARRAWEERFTLERYRREILSVLEALVAHEQPEGAGRE